MRGVLVLCGALVIVLMQRAQHDKSIKRVDSVRLMNARRISFIAIAGGDAAFLITLSPWALITLFAMTGVLMTVDIIGLGQRPPHNGHRTAVAAGGYAYPLRRVIAFFRR